MLRGSAVHHKRHDPLIAFWSGVHRFLWVRRQFAKAAGLSNNQYELLLAVKACEDKRPNIAFMADRLLLEHHVVASIARYLDAQRLLEVKRSHSDRRALSLSLTPKGKRLLGDLARRSVAALEIEGPGLVKALSDVLPPNRSFQVAVNR